MLNAIGAQQLSETADIDAETVDVLSFAVADVDRLVKCYDGKEFVFSDFTKNPKLYGSDFMRWAAATDILICAHLGGEKRLQCILVRMI